MSFFKEILFIANFVLVFYSKPVVLNLFNFTAH